MVTNGRRFEGRRTVVGKVKGRRFKGMRRVAGKSNGCRFEGRRRVADSKECEGSSGSRMVAGSKECEGSPLSLIGDGWLLTELHRQRWELNHDDGSLTTTVRLFCFFFFFTEIWHDAIFSSQGTVTICAYNGEG